MTSAPSRPCPHCQEPIPAGALYCLKCGASSPTEIAPTKEEIPVVRAPLDIPARKAAVQAMLGAGFTLRGLLGRGGFGEVWAATDVQLSRAVAIKVLRPELAATPGFRERFQREARAIAQLRHPGIVPIYHVGEANGLTWFVMPLIEGITLKDAMRAPEGLTLDEGRRILAEAAAALREAHAHGIIHRDLKPENIMLEGPSRRVLLMDFGVARMEDSDHDGLTETDVVLGSPEYMSPEQATGRALDARTDIYSLGVVAYRMLAGRLPFEATTPREVLAHHVLSPPDPVDRYARLPPALAEAVMRCLAKNPDERWSGAAELLTALQSEAMAGPVAERRTLPPAEAPAVIAPPVPAPPPRRRRVALAAGVIALVLLGATPFPFLRWRARQRVGSIVAGVTTLYRQAADSLVTLGRLFDRGDITGSRYVAARQELDAGTLERVDAEYGDALADSASWAAPLRDGFHAAVARTASSPGVVLFTVAPSDVPGCRMRESGDTTRLGDEAPRDNCWWRVRPVPSARAPAEYFLDFRTEHVPSADAGTGLAWCRGDADCRVVFIWSGDKVVWGAHRPHAGLATLQLGARGTLRMGSHEMRVRIQRDTLRVWVDGALSLERPAAADVPYLESPSAFYVIVQNTSVALPGAAEFGAVGAVLR